MLSGYESKVRAVTFSPNGQYLFASNDKLIKKFSIEDGKEISSFEGHSDEVLCISVSGDGLCIVSGSIRKILLHNVEDGTIQRQVEAHGNWVRSVAFS